MSQAPERTVEEWQAILSGPPEFAARALMEAAQAGDPQAALQWGQCLLDGHGTPPDPRAALGWFHTAAKAGLPMGMNMVGRCLDQGSGAAADPAAAAPWFEAAAQAGLDWGQYNFATALALGRGVDKDLPRALALFRAAAAQGHAKSSTMIGSFYEDGWAVPANLSLAAYHYARGAEGGDFRGCFNHARLLVDSGRIDDAIPWLRKAYALGHERFRAQLGQWLAARPESVLQGLAEGNCTDL
ncbi:sel1 repeat family protein [Novosphingobium umbonatum]|uniref:Sel1 repeat family protein n=1 Tax=Novosphingobium umbonatum TaxID=1908524 RepID=A0A3S3TLA5_9SPHN|nr:tetratricopeptide repeat protein [Novosphingobium umbonatum]RVU03647.1 sel1 repeat family protein [Novosphingobium umbonatum]